MSVTMTLLVWLAKATALLMLAMGLTIALRRAPAGARYLVWLATLAALLLVPVMSAWSPIPLPILPSETAAFGPLTAPASAKIPTEKPEAVAPAASAPAQTTTTQTRMSPYTIAFTIWGADVREMAAWALVASNARDAVDALVNAMRKDESADVRETSAWALAELNARRTIDALADVAANDSDSEVRGTAAWAIGNLHPGKAPAALVKAIRDADPEVRLKAAWALSEIGDPDATPAILEALKTETRERVQQAEVRALLRSGDGSEEVFRRLLESKDADTREMAVRALAGRKGFGPWPWPWPRPRPMP